MLRSECSSLACFRLMRFSASLFLYAVRIRLRSCDNTMVIPLILAIWLPKAIPNFSASRCPKRQWTAFLMTG